MKKTLGTKYITTTSAGGEPAHTHVVPIQLDELREILEVETTLKHAPTTESILLTHTAQIAELQETVKDLLEMIEEQ